VHTTVYDIPAGRTLIRWLALMVFRLSGWRAEGQKPAISKYVIIAAPHTSNWDFFYTLCLAFILRMKPLIMMKDTWFRGPLGPFLKWLGALPVNRSKSNNVVAQSIGAFHAHSRFVLLVPPSGTRKRVMYWKTGFYHIAKGADVPIVLGYLDYRRRAGGIGPMLKPTGDMEADMKKIRHFYKNITGKYPKRGSGPQCVERT